MKRSQEKGPSFHQTALDYLDALYGYGMVLTRDRQDAEDLVQETYLRALGAYERLRPDSNIKSWMFAILRNIHLNEIRSKRSSVQAVDFEDDTDPICESSMEGPYDFCVDRSKREDIRQAVESLPPPYREIIILREFEELSYEEIARILECPLGTVMSRLARARGKLKLTLGQWDPAASRTSLRQGGQA